jgi:hypothetical protein
VTSASTDLMGRSDPFRASLAEGICSSVSVCCAASYGVEDADSR